MTDESVDMLIEIWEKELVDGYGEEYVIGKEIKEQLRIKILDVVNEKNGWRLGFRDDKNGVAGLFLEVSRWEGVELVWDEVKL